MCNVARSYSFLQHFVHMGQAIQNCNLSVYLYFSNKHIFTKRLQCGITSRHVYTEIFSAPELYANSNA